MSISEEPKRRTKIINKGLFFCDMSIMAETQGLKLLSGDTVDKKINRF